MLDVVIHFGDHVIHSMVTLAQTLVQTLAQTLAQHTLQNGAFVYSGFGFMLVAI